MPNVFFNNYDSYSEQSLVDNLVVESLKMYGHTVYYLPRALVKRDDIWTEDQLSTYSQAFEFDMYIRSYDSFEGDGVSTTLSGFFGSVPTTTYGENIGVMAITRVYSVWVIGGAALISIVMAFIS